MYTAREKSMAELGLSLALVVLATSVIQKHGPLKNLSKVTPQAIAPMQAY
jgi:hypothetical protein